jgi:hypothetical protein
MTLKYFHVRNFRYRFKRRYKSQNNINSRIVNCNLIPKYNPEKGVYLSGDLRRIAFPPAILLWMPHNAVTW